MMALSWFGRCWQWQIGGCVAIVGTLSAGVSQSVLAQIVPDNTLGAESSVVTPNVNIKGIPGDRIDGGGTRGANLFHSFQEFNVREGSSTYFANPTGIENILTRVTGRNASNILGRLGVLGGANLFLLNPNGIIFGANASLDIQGSFVATTAERIQLGDSGYFSASQPQTSSLLAVSPGALFFSEVASQPTAIINQGNLSTGKHLTLLAGNLDLQGQLQAQGDLTLQAQDTVKVRDSAKIPFRASAGGNLLVQGDLGVDIFALSHPESGLFSGGDMVLRSTNTVGGDAHYWSGGSFRIEKLNGSLGNLSSPHDPILRARGDVFINSYQGASLHILAGGKVEIPGYIWIQGADPENGLVETVNLADGTSVSINGKSVPTLDIRAGVNPDVIGEQIFTLNGTGNFSNPIYVSNNQSSADIKIGTILFTDADNVSVPVVGRVLLTNQYQPNSSLSGDIQVTDTQQGRWGAISIDGGAGNPSVAINSRGSIKLDGTVNTSSSSGDGGAITLNAANGNITTGSMNSQAGGTGNSGNITLTSNAGAIDTTKGDITSQIRENSNGTGRAGTIVFTAKDNIQTASLNASAEKGDSGNIQLTSTNGEIDTSKGTLATDSQNGNGGAIALTALGNITTGNLLSYSHSTSDNAANGGAINLIATDDNINTNNSLGNLYSSHDPIILSNGDVTLGNYEGASLHILAGGSVTLSNVTITGTGDATTTINPTNTSFNGSRTYADLATFNLTDYKATLNSDGSVRSVDPVLVPITINGSTQAMLDVKAGVDWAALGGLPTNQVLPGTPPPTMSQPFAPTVSKTATSANITVNGNIQVTQPTGLVLLTNQFSPNTLPGTISIRGNVNTSTRNTGANGGDIRVYGRGDIAVVSSDIESFSDSKSGNAGNGGRISFATNSGNITLSNSYSSSSSSSYSGNAGNGGVISFATNSGNISLSNSNSNSNSYSSSSSNSNSTSYSGNAGNGGVISFATNSGNISLRDSESISYSQSGSGSSSYSRSTSYSNSKSGNAGNGGVISFATNSGNISLWDSYSTSSSRLTSTSTSNSNSTSNSSSGNAGNGGVISFATNSGNITFSNSFSSSTSTSSSFSTSNSTSNSGNAGNGGVISFATNSGNITFSNSDSNSSSTSNSYSSSSSSSGNAGNGGVISFATNSGNITLSNSNSYSNSYSDSDLYSDNAGNAGNGGTIHLSARRGTISGNNSVLNSFAVSKLGGSGNGGKVTLETGIGVSGLTINTLASGGKSGNVEINGFGDLLIDQTNILTAQEVEVKLCETCSSITIPLNDRGQAGNVAVTSTGSLAFSNSVIQSDTRGGNPAGSTTITSPGIVSFNDSQIISNTSSTGQAGSITLQAPELRLDSSSRLSAETSSSGSAGNLTLQPYDGGQTLSILFQEGAQISASTSDQGTGGNLRIIAPDSVTIQGQGTITTSTTGTGNAGNMILDTSTLTVARGAQLFALTEGSGNSGTIEVNASTAVNLGIGVDDFSPVLSVETSNAGKAGSIIINTPSLTLSDTARITATATSTATNPLAGGSITLNASTMDLAGVVGVFAETQGQTPAGTLTLKPYENQSTLNLTLAPQSLVSASTTGSGKGGNLIVQAPEAITIQGPGQLAVQTTGDGAAGELRIDTQRLTIADGATISASTSSKNPEGTGGSIIINATESFNLTNQASLGAQSTGAAPAGKVTINTPNLTATNGTIATSSVLSSGGDITITASDIRLFESDIRTDVASGADSGGNINLTANSIIAFGDSDILAYADRNDGGTGGNITLDTRAFFGENYSPASSRNDPPNTLDGNNRVDVNATGAIEGVITLPDTTFIQNSLTELPDTQINTDNLLANSCIVRRHQPTKGSFIVTGTGGLPQRPGDPKMSSFPTVDVATLPSDSNSSTTNPNRPWQKGDPIVEPQGVYRLTNGKLVLSRECS